ncbi:MAG TPA: valine--tRNA ligase [Gammaproteobacteria bacterium]|nr:valine--tRNA ligase [Gammaproteobacteria bacterium]
MEKAYEPRGMESRWYETWEKHGWFAPRASGTPYCILLPPPNVTGTLHMGHAFQQTLMDALTRYHRMRGERVLWQGGTDHAGIATQKIVENQLAAAGQTRHDLGRDAFLKKVWEWKEESGSTITRQMRRLGASVDWSRERFTMDAGLSAAVRRVFVAWYRDGLLYRGKRLVHWDPVLQTAVSDLEVNNEERDGSLWLIRYPAAAGGKDLTVATTRPETMLGDVAVAVHPEDERYKDMMGKQLKLPLTGRLIPVIADEYVDKDFGTGCVKITPAHDFNDQKLGQRHGLANINVFTLDGKVNDEAPEVYRGLDRFVARKKIVADLDAAGLLVETKKHKLMVPISQRSDAVIEPMLTDQWFLDLTRDTLPDGRPGGKRAITEPALAAVRGGAIKFTPENWSTTYVQWLENIQDWCVSRQLWWGHQIPAWYDEADNIFVGEDEADALKHSGIKPVGKLRQDEDVLDTWFSSALWPFSTLGWPGDTPARAEEWERFRDFLPSSVLITGFDIIFFWVARMVMATQYFTKQVPFRGVYINAIVRDAEGQKMSKSKGNTIDPLDLIDGVTLEELVKKSTASLLIPQVREKVEKRVRKDYPQGIPPVGADALRFTFAALATYSRTINFDLKRCEGYKNFCNKLWNASRYVLMNTEGKDNGAHGGELAFSLADRWIQSRLSETLSTVEKEFASYRFDLAAQALYEFTWNEFCDWYLELSKPALQGEGVSSAHQRGTRHTLVTVLETLLRALHPITPFITEEIWQKVGPMAGKQSQSVMLQPYPKGTDFKRDPQAEQELRWLQEFILGVRRIRAEMDIAPGKEMPVLLQGAAASDLKRVEQHRALLVFIARLSGIEVQSQGEPPPSATALLGEMKILVPMAGLIDMDAERARLAKEIARVEGEIGKCQAKLGKPDFVDNAPPAVVEKERQRLRDFEMTLQGLREQLRRLAAS